jgi:hypothetical protein
LAKIEDWVFSSCQSLKSFHVPPSVEVMGTGCFATCETMTEFTFAPRSKLTLIMQWAFRGCTLFESIYIPVSVKKMPRECFYHCVSLQTVSFEPDSRLVRIEVGAFDCCSSLKSICIPASVQMIDATAFMRSNITKIEVEDGNTHFSIDGDCLVDFARISLLLYFGISSFVNIGMSRMNLGISFECHI